MNESRQSISERLERFEFLLLRLDTYFHKVIEPDVILAIFLRLHCYAKCNAKINNDIAI